MRVRRHCYDFRISSTADASSSWFCIHRGTSRIPNQPRNAPYAQNYTRCASNSLILMEYNECGRLVTLPLSYPRLRPACEPTPLYQLQRDFVRLCGSSAALKKTGSRWSVTSSQVVLFSTSAAVPKSCGRGKPASSAARSKSQTVSIRRQPVARLIYNTVWTVWSHASGGYCFPTTASTPISLILPKQVFRVQWSRGNDFYRLSWHEKRWRRPWCPTARVRHSRFNDYAMLIQSSGVREVRCLLFGWSVEQG